MVNSSEQRCSLFLLRRKILPKNLTPILEAIE
ncbi:ribosome maturation factor RimP, partial [Lactobacillus delbrueckii subsp. bulgaricus]|nr:ribosome maturation factor RimP [Lactobacillus delbrueckii subsp. bulgaricus]